MAIPAASQTLSQRWFMTLTGAQRADWQTLLDAGPYPACLAVPTAPTARRLYMRVNLLRKLCGAAPVDDAPADQALTDLLTVTPAAAHTPTVSIAFTATPLTAGHRLLMLATKGFPAADPPGDRAVKVLGVSDAAKASPDDALAIYAARFGNPVEGESIRFVTHALKEDVGAVGDAVDHTVVVT